MEYFSLNVSIEELTGLINFVGKGLTLIIKQFNEDSTLTVDFICLEDYKTYIENYISRMRDRNVVN